MRRALLGSAALGAAIATALVGAAASAQGNAASFAAQVAEGRTLFATNCAVCHGEALTGGQFAGVLKGPGFMAKWGGVPIGELEAYIHASMPPGQAGRLSDEQYAALAALVVHENGGDPGGPVTKRLATLMPPAPHIEESGGLASIGGISPRYPMPAWPAPKDRFANYTPVTEAMLNDPAPENWLTWRRSHTAHGFSPLTQIDQSNVDRLTVAWAQALPVGPNMNEPLVRDGVLYVHGFGDQVFAFDAATGRPIWRYQRQLPEGTNPLSKKTMALWGDMVLTSTSDLHMVALDARTGRPKWDVAMLDDPEGFRNPGGPLVADGVVMNGLATTQPGGGRIVAFDVETGEKLWQFETVAKTGTPGGDTWNDIPDDERRGGSQWTSGTYDPVTGLALWGVAQTYDTGPLRDRQPGSNNDGLYTNSTLAFVPRTGELKWFYQHMPNDQYDLDWVFERVVGTIDVGGQDRRVVITGGKEGLFDALDAQTGRYIKTVDMGFQDFIVDIDPVTGRKTPDPDLLPGRDRPSLFMCPHAGGGRNWSPTAYDEASHTLFVNARDTCMELVPVQDGGFLSSGVSVFYSAPEDSDGNFGFVQAIDMDTGQVKWESRQRAPHDMGMLATSGGLVFTGGMDRQFVAHDQQSGKVLWRTGLTGVPNGSPISYAVDGKQYVALVTGMGSPLSLGLPGFTPEIPVPQVNSSAIYVFALPDTQ